jgi:hypothetical protein
MSRHAVKFEYPHKEIFMILRNSYKENEYYGVDKFESKRLKIILAKYGCRHSYHTLPGKLTSTMHPFSWDKLSQCFRIEMDKKVPVHLNTLEEAVVHHHYFEKGRVT